MELELHAAAKKRSGEDDVALLEGILARRLQMPWMGRREIAAYVLAHHGLTWSERKVRGVASRSLAIASAPGMNGYAFAELLPVEQLEHCGRGMMAYGRAAFSDGVRLMRIAALKRKTAEIAAPVAPIEQPQDLRSAANAAQGEPASAGLRAHETRGGSESVSPSAQSAPAQPACPGTDLANYLAGGAH